MKLCAFLSKYVLEFVRFTVRVFQEQSVITTARVNDVSSLSYVCFVGVDLCAGRFLRGYFLRCQCCGLKEFLRTYSLQGMRIVFDDV